MESLRVFIWPAFHNKSLIELKSDGEKWTLIFTKEAFDFTKDPGRIWHSMELSRAEAIRLIHLAEEIITNPSRQKWFVINDGMSVNVKLNRGGKEFFREQITVEQETREAALLNKLFDLSAQLFGNSELETYITAVKTYFLE